MESTDNYNLLLIITILLGIALAYTYYSCTTEINNLKAQIAIPHNPFQNTVIKSNGENIGIDNQNPNSKLDIGSVGGAINLSGTGIPVPTQGLVYGLFPHRDVGLGFYSYHGGISFWSGAFPTEYMRLMNGNLGIGVLDPKNKLEVNGGIKLLTSIPKPICDETERGLIWYSIGSEGQRDRLEICLKTAYESYTWTSLNY